MTDRELDALVAEKVMGKKWSGARWGRGALPHYSTDIAAAWQVVEKLQADGFALLLDGNLHEQWTAAFTKGEPDGTGNEFRTASTAPMAISLAALATVGVSVEPSPADTKEKL